MSKSIGIRRADNKDISTIEKYIAKWLSSETPREESIIRGIRKKELLVADQQGRVIGFIHKIIHEDIIDGGLNSFITCFYVAPKFRNMGVGSKLLRKAIRDALSEGAVGIEVSTASQDARRFYERHHFKQFMGKETMGEIFLELDIEEYKRSLKIKSKARAKSV